MYTPIFDRDLLYPTNKVMDPGSVHVAIMKPDNHGKLPVFISAKSGHNPLDYVETLIGVIQADIFDRIRINIKEQGIFYFVLESNDLVRLIYQDGKQFTDVIKNDFIRD